MDKNAKALRGPAPRPRVQAGALPWRRTGDDAIEVLLITSRETRRWVIPKGWPIKGLKPPQTAAREAFEEAGVEGEVTTEVGVFHYHKRLRNGRHQQVQVRVYPLRVEIEHDAWPEADQREKLWAAPDAAAELVSEPDLAVILRTFSPKQI